MTRLNIETATYLTAVADAILKAEKALPIGDFYVKEVHFGLAGEDAGVRLVMNDVETFDIEASQDI